MIIYMEQVRKYYSSASKHTTQYQKNRDTDNYKDNYTDKYKDKTDFRMFPATFPPPPRRKK